MKTVVLASITGAALALAIGGAACQSSSGGDTTPDPTGGAGTSSAGGSSAGTTSAGGTTSTGGTGTAGTPGAGGTGTAGTPGAGGTGTAGTPGTGGTGTAGTTGTGGTGTAGSSAGGSGGQCSKVTTLHPPNPDAGTATIFCPFSAVDGGKNDYCEKGTQHCCESPMGDPVPTSCVDINTACGSAKATDWQCEDPSDCGTGMQCCGNGSVVISPDPMCGNFASKMTGTKCKAACDPTTDITMCTSDDECGGGGKTCIPFAKAGNQVGGCSK